MKERGLRKIDIVGLTFGLVVGSGLTYVFAVSGNEVDYDNTSSKLSATTVQAAIDELYDNYQNCDKCDIEEGKVYNFSYTGSEQTFTVPCNGNYKIETWGAQGGHIDSTYFGGYGGYSVGNINLSKDTNLYINVGGKGEYKTGDNLTATGGYNGGGSAYTSNYSTGTYKNSSGGGATHVSTASGLLSSLNNNKQAIIEVAAGGGGASYWDEFWRGAGGSGGGIVGNDGIVIANDYNGTGATQTAGGTCSKGNYNIGLFGKAVLSNYDYTTFTSTSTNNTNRAAGAGGGGGYYGGGGGCHAGGGGGGGSGYIGNSLLSDKYMYCYNCQTSSATSTKTYTTANVSSTATAKYAKSGDGYARITYLG